jgi:hypothetical protein
MAQKDLIIGAFTNYNYNQLNLGLNQLMSVVLLATKLWSLVMPHKKQLVS